MRGGGGGEALPAPHAQLAPAARRPWHCSSTWMAFSAATLACAMTRYMASRLFISEHADASSLAKAMQSAFLLASRLRLEASPFERAPAPGVVCGGGGSCEDAVGCGGRGSDGDYKNGGTHVFTEERNTGKRGVAPVATGIIPNKYPTGRGGEGL